MGELPFTIEQFLGVFSDYNRAIWPAQLVAYVLGILVIALAIRKRSFTDRAIPFILASFWIWMGVVYHAVFFSEINVAAYLFGLLFAVQGTLFLLAGPVYDALRFRFRRDRYGWVGAALVLYAMAGYPLLGVLSGHVYPEAPVFGVAPCPTTIFTFGVLLWTVGTVPGWLLLIPGLWTVIGLSAALNLGMREDLGLLVAGVAGIGLLLYRNRRAKSAADLEDVSTVPVDS